MATMYSLFLGLLFVAVCILGSVSDHAVTRIGVDQLRSEDALRARIVEIAGAEIGVREATGHNDGARVEEYLAYTGLDKGHAWCAAFVSWCYGQAGRSAPRNAWSPALFPMARRYTDGQIRQGSVQPADLFGIYNAKLGRIDHVGLVRKRAGNWLLTIEGNVDNRVLSKRRSAVTIHAFSNWLEGG